MQNKKSFFCNFGRILSFSLYKGSLEDWGKTGLRIGDRTQFHILPPKGRSVALQSAINCIRSSYLESVECPTISSSICGKTMKNYDSKFNKKLSLWLTQPISQLPTRKRHHASVIWWRNLAREDSTSFFCYIITLNQKYFVTLQC